LVNVAPNCRQFCHMGFNLAALVVFSRVGHKLPPT
jgi:hypothetical protein